MRREPYTTRGLRRLPCSRCGQKPSYANWNICADNVGNRPQHRPICAACDVELNERTMLWAFGDSAETRGKLAAYRQQVLG